MSEQWPPERGERDEDLPATETDHETAAETRLADVTAFLASVPAPALPDAVAARISAAIDAEAAARTAGTTVRSRTLGSAPTRARARRWRFRLGLRPAAVLAPVLGCLVVALIAFAVAHGGASSGSSSAAPAAEPPGASAPSAAIAQGPAEGGTSGQTAGIPDAAFVQSGTSYQQPTLARQVETVLAQASAINGGSKINAAAPSASSRGTSALIAFTPPPGLAGCALHVTGGAVPAVVDRATYQGTPAYIIAVPTRAWVVGLGCTASDPELIVSVSLAG